MLIILGFALFFERYCFIVAVYKTKNYGYVLILVVLLFNTLFLFLISRLRTKKNEKKLHELYNIDRAPNPSWCIIIIVGILDMLKSFLLYWPANIVPLWMLVSMMQLFIPLNMILRSCCLESVFHYNIHWISGLIIFVGCIISLTTILFPEHEQMVSINFDYTFVAVGERPQGRSGLLQHTFVYFLHT
jgi:hypothetical protein